MKWISVTDRLPESNLFLGYCPSQGIHCFKNDGDYCVVGGWESCCYCGGQSIGVLPGQDEANNGKEKITHWMSLPPSPDEEQKILESRKDLEEEHLNRLLSSTDL